MSHILFALQGGTCGAFVCGIAIAGAEAKNLDQRQQWQCLWQPLTLAKKRMRRADFLSVSSRGA